MSRTPQFENSKQSPISSHIGRRIILILILISSAVTLITTLIQTYWDYNRELSAVESRHYEIEKIHIDLLAPSLWRFDLELLQQRIEGLVNLPKVDYLEVEADNYIFRAGTPVEKQIISSRYPIKFSISENEPKEVIGSLYVESDANTIYSYLLKQFLITLGINALKTAIVCYLILMIFHQSVNRRLFSIAQYLRKFNPRNPSKPLTLQYTPWIMEKEDELKWLGDETNKITSSVSSLYRDIKYQQERFADFADVSSDWLWETNESGVLIYASDEMVKNLNLSGCESVPLFNIPTFNKTHSLLAHINAKLSFSLCEEKLIIEGQERFLLFQGTAKYQDDTFTGFRGTALDISALTQAKVKLEELNHTLENKVKERTQELENNMVTLQKTQDQLVESEKLAALGGLVAGVAHEVNTPLGISVTAASIIKEITQELNQAFADQTLSSVQFADLMERMSESTIMLEDNLNRGSKLIRDFKQTAVNQVSECRSNFVIHQVLDALITSLHPETRKIPVTPIISGSDTLSMSSLPGVLTQVITNLIMNSINHAFADSSEPAKISISFYEQNNEIIFEYIDNGSGIEEALHQKIFEPFYTSKRGNGGSGLGLNLVFNLIHQKLAGSLNFESSINQGVHFTFRTPKELPISPEQSS